MKREDLVEVRGFDLMDRNFIFKTWMRGVLYSSPLFKDVEAKTFYRNYQAILEELFLLPHTKVRVACLKEDHSVILGYCVYENKTLHWVYVKKPWRGIGIARMLVDFPVQTVTHQTPVGRELTLKYHFKFNPFR